jgi:hypothetical protein
MNNLAAMAKDVQDTTGVASALVVSALTEALDHWDFWGTNTGAGAAKVDMAKLEKKTLEFLNRMQTDSKNFTIVNNVLNAVQKFNQLADNTSSLGKIALNQGTTNVDKKTRSHTQAELVYNGQLTISAFNDVMAGLRAAKSSFEKQTQNQPKQTPSSTVQPSGTGYNRMGLL